MRKLRIFLSIAMIFIGESWLCAEALSSETSVSVVIESAEEAVAVALHHSKDQLYQMWLAQEGLEYSQLDFKEFLPQLGLSYSESDNVKEGMADSRNKSVQLTVNQMIFDGGVAWQNYQLGKLSSLYRYQQVLLSQDEFKGKVLDAYYGILQQIKVVAIKERLAQSANRRLEIMEEELQLGMVVEVDYLEYLISCRRLDQEENLARQELDGLKEEFRQLVGLDYGVTLEFPESEVSYNDRKSLEADFDQLASLAISSSPSLKLQRLEYETGQRQQKMSRLWFIPSINLEGSIQVSGTEFPLREPDFSLKLKVSFQRNEALPLSTNTSLGFSQKDFQSLGNSVSGNFSPDPTFFSQRRMNRITLLQQKLALVQSEEQLRDTLRELVQQHDGGVEELDYSLASFQLQRRRVDIALLRLQQGELTELEYLEALTQLASMEIQLTELENQLDSLVRGIELAAGIAPGGLDEVLFN